jgi:EAL domain-containing protein (putative c-di-GMP-specific phosphodiesterase class I)
MLRIIAELKEIDVDVAYDDFGAGQSRLLELVKAPPTYLKFDRCLSQGLHEAPVHQQRLIRTLTDIARDFNTLSLGEGIETEEEAGICKDLGMAYGQGYFFGRPSAAPILPKKDKPERATIAVAADAPEVS